MEQQDLDRMEFVGDATLNFLISSGVMSYHTPLTAHKMSVYRAYLVSGASIRTLSDVLGVKCPDGSSDKVCANTVERAVGIMVSKEGLFPVLREFKPTVYKYVHDYILGKESSGVIDLLVSL